MRKYVMILFVGSSIIVIYSLLSRWYLNNNWFGNYLQLTGKCGATIDYVVYPYFTSENFVNGLIAKYQYRKLIGNGLEIDESPLALKNSEFRIFYDGYICGIANPSSFGTHGQNPRIYSLGSEMGRNCLPSAINRMACERGIGKLQVYYLEPYKVTVNMHRGDELVIDDIIRKCALKMSAILPNKAVQRSP